MPVHTRTPIQRKKYAFRIGIVLAPLILALGLSGVAQAATIPFTFSVSATASVLGTPSPSTLTVPGTVIGSGSFAPFGTAAYSERGTVTYTMLPSGNFVPVSVMNDFTASFNAGVDTFSGTDSVIGGPPDATGLPTLLHTMTVLSGTGLFAGATGFGTAAGPSPASPNQVFFSGNGQITTPGLNSVPEPTVMALLTAGVVGLVGLAAIRKQRHHSADGST